MPCHRCSASLDSWCFPCKASIALGFPGLQVENTITDVYSFMDATNNILDESMEDEPAKSPASSLPPSVKNTPRLSAVEASGLLPKVSIAWHGRLCRHRWWR